MLRLIFSFSLLILLFDNGLSQYLPQSYVLKGEEKLSKVVDKNPASNSISDIITIGDTVWIGTSRGVSLSTDRGETWTNFSDHPAFESRGISAIRYDYNTSTFWAAKAFTTKGPADDDVQTGGGYAFTTDAGKTWVTQPQAMDNEDDSLITYGINDGINLPQIRAVPVTVPQQNVTFDIAFTPGTIWITSFAAGLRKSTDNGQTWQRVLLPSDELNEISPDDTIRYALQPVAGNFGPDDHLNHRAFSVIAINDSTIYVGTAGGINKSTDGGISWRKFNHTNQENSIGGNWVIALDFDPTNKMLWAGTWRAEGQTEFYGIASTSDGGENWQTYLKDEKVYNFGFKSGDVMAPSDNGVFRTSNRGITWILPNSIVDKQTGVPFLGNMFYSASSQGNYIWLGSNDGLLRLNENVVTMWEGDWKIYFAATPLESREQTYAYPNPFSPKLDLLKIKYSTGDKQASVTIRIFDFEMNIVRTIIQNATRQKSLEDPPDNWDGRDENGSVVPNGVYFYRVEVDDDEPVYGKILVLQ